MGETYALSDIDVSLIGNVKFADGLGRIPIGLSSALHQDLSINLIAYPWDIDFTDVSQNVVDALNNPNKTPGNVSLLLFPLWWANYKAKELIPEKSHIKIAYSMVETTKIPSRAVFMLNNSFDAVAVPDEFYQNVYQESGVTIPIFVLPHGIFLEEFLDEPLKEYSTSEQFVFGLSATFCDRKNQNLLIEAFHEEFDYNDNVSLILHGRGGDQEYLKNLEEKVEKLNIKNITVVKSKLRDQEYKQLLKSLDCYVLISKGEGFSVTPREALALGIPTIITNNTAHKTICKTGHVCSIPSDIQQRSNFNELGLGEFGNDFNCTVEDVQKALREVYSNHKEYVEKAQQGRKWVKQYLWENLKKKFHNLIKPNKVILGSEDHITDESLTTKSEKLYNKYCQLLET